MAVTTAEVTDRKGALQACKRCKAVLNRVQSVLTDSGYTGEPFARGVREVLASRSLCRLPNAASCTLQSLAQALGGGAQLCWSWTRIAGYRRTASAGSIPACSSSTGIPGVAAQKIVNTFSVSRCSSEINATEPVTVLAVWPQIVAAIPQP